MSQEKEFYIGQIFTTQDAVVDNEGNVVTEAITGYPPEAAMWCNEQGNCFISDKGDGSFEIVAIPEPTQEEINAQRLVEIDARLAQIDMERSRPMGAIIAGNGTQSDQDKLLSLEEEATSLRNERTLLTGV